MLDKENLIYILDKLFDQSKKYYDDFNSSDAKIGDGDCKSSGGIRRSGRLAVARIL